MIFTFCTRITHANKTFEHSVKAVSSKPYTLSRGNQSPKRYLIYNFKKFFLDYPLDHMPSNASNTSSSRIQSVQGLRAVAVIGVLLFHAQVAGIAGGFVGVDVFFVISGFVITLLLRKQMESEQFSFAEFYKRRAWRLMPALAVTLLFTTVLFGFLMPTSENPTLFYALVSAAFGVSNFYFNNTLDYFDSGITNPVLHTWSLGVEEQFYLMFPLLLWWLYRKFGTTTAEKVRTTVLGLTAAGFAFAVYQTYTHQSSAFYLPWFRAWEFSTGAAVAFLSLKTLPASLSKLCSWVGMLILIPVMLFYHEHYIFPGIGAVLPVLATMFLLIGSQNQSLINQVLASKPFRFIGDLSYSLYLVHWPVVCFIGLFISLNNPITQLLTIVASCILGFLSWYFIEEKFRHGIKPLINIKKAFTPIALMLISASMVTLSALGTNSFWNQFPDAKQHFAETSIHADLFREGQCFLVAGEVNQYDKATCLTINPDKENVIVMGDSLAANLVTILQEAHPDKHFMQATALDYIPGNPLKWSSIAKELDNVVQQYYRAQGRNIHTFILYALWQDDDLAPLKERVKQLKSLGHRVVVVGPSPQLYVGAPIILAHSEILHYDFGRFLFKKNRQQMNHYFEVNLDEVDEYNSSYNKLCPNGQCSLHVNGKPMFFDKVHLTKAGAEHLVRQLSL